MIYINEEKLEFHLTNQKISYIFRVMEDTGVLEQLYTGSAIDSYPSYDFLLEREIRPGNNLLEGKLLSSFEHIKQECPVYGTTDFRYSAIEVQYPDGDSISHFRYQGYEVKKGKQARGSLPGTFGSEQEVEALAIQLKDDYSDLELVLYYTIYQDYPVITRQARLKNNGARTMLLKQLASFNLDIPNEEYDWLHLDGAWAREFHLSRERIHNGVQFVSSTRGASSHIHNPFFAICTPHATENTGEVYGINLIYSGNFRAQIELDSYNQLRIQLGINPFQFSWELKTGDEFLTPEAVLVYSHQGFNDMSQTFHRFYKNHLIRSDWKNKQRPVLLNSWEATYFEFYEQKILEIAQALKELGIELFVLDDGWFANRNRDNGSLGNWIPDKEKFPSGFGNIVSKIKEMGLLFGLWFEPEMVSSDVPLYQSHPEWIIGHPEKNISQGRNQYILDFANPKVVEVVFEQMDKILQEVPIDYLKLDMNRYLSESFSNHLSKTQQGEVAHRYILGVYELYEKLISKYPHILIESCAGGGARFDAGMLYYSPQIWTSDDTDAVERLFIQSGASMVYPLSTMGAHVSAVPNHQVARVTSFEMRKNVALFGVFGYELNPLQLSDREKDLVRQQIEEYHKYEQLILNGHFYRLELPSENKMAWMVVSPDKTEALVGYYTILRQPNSGYERLKLQGLAPEFTYCFRICDKKQIRKGRDLASIGLLLSENYLGREEEYWSRERPGDFHSQIVYLEADKTCQIE